MIISARTSSATGQERTPYTKIYQAFIIRLNSVLTKNSLLIISDAICIWGDNTSVAIPNGDNDTRQAFGGMPILDAPVPLVIAPRYGATLAIGLVLACTAYFAANGLWGLESNKHLTHGVEALAPALKLSSSEVPGALGVIEKALTANSEHVFGQLLMPREEKARLKVELERTPMRIGRLIVWDTMDQDDDRIRITGSGFSQDVVIGHAPKSFFVPYLPGTDIKVLATHDGGGGGVTLGISTTLGPVSLPHVAAGQTIEIAVP
jgi:hypothetical protein